LVHRFAERKQAGHGYRRKAAALHYYSTTVLQDRKSVENKGSITVIKE
jgi:hypothetical protein